MVSKASEDLPLPESPVTTTMTSRGSETVMFFRLCSRAPRTSIWLSAISFHPFAGEAFVQVYGPRSGGQGSIDDVGRFYHPEGAILPKETPSYIFSVRAMILKDLSRILVEELGANPVAPGDAARPVHGLAVEEPTEGWIEKDEVAVTSREDLDGAFLRSVRDSGSPAVVWRRDAESSPEIEERTANLGLGLFIVSPEVPLRRLHAVFSGGDGLLLLSHGVGRTLLESAGGDASRDGLPARGS